MNVKNISKAREKLLAKQAAALASIDAQIKHAEMVERGKVRVERLLLRVVAKQPNLFLVDPAKLEQLFEASLASIAVQLSSN